MSLSQRGVVTSPVEPSTNSGGFEDEHACTFHFCYRPESPHIVFYKCDRRKWQNKATALQCSCVQLWSPQLKVFHLLEWVQK